MVFRGGCLFLERVFFWKGFVSRNGWVFGEMNFGGGVWCFWGMIFKKMVRFVDGCVYG